MINEGALKFDAHHDLRTRCPPNCNVAKLTSDEVRDDAGLLVDVGDEGDEVALVRGKERHWRSATGRIGTFSATNLFLRS